MSSMNPPLGTMRPGEKCRMFSQANEALNEFYTPLYPNHYPNNTECILTLSASYGYLIRIDFRDYFDLEPSAGKCDNDYLEIRDGAHGYSDLMGRFCGSDFPPIITSKDRHLWLKFRSDDTLQYRGFRAVYEFIKNTGTTTAGARRNRRPQSIAFAAAAIHLLYNALALILSGCLELKIELDRPDIGPCKFERGGVEGLITHSDIPEFRTNYSLTYGVPLDCTWIITVDDNNWIYMFFENFKLDEPNECDMNYVDLFGAERDLSSRIQHYCGSVADPVVNKGNIMHFRFFATREALTSGFKAWFTAFRDRMHDKTSKCEANEYDCDDATCIDASLKCNGIKNCRHEYDEEGCDKNKKGKFDINSEHIIVILTLGCGLLAGMCFAMCFNCIKKLVRDGRQIHENIRRSREQLEEQRSISIGSSPKMAHRGRITTEDEEAYIEGKRNGHTCIHPDEEDTEEEDEEDEEEEEEEESCVEMRDCECQTRDSLLAQRDSGLHGTPPPPPPPTRRPPGLPPLSPPLAVPTPPPPPVTHSPYYNRHHPANDPYVSTYHHHHHHSASSQQTSDNYDGDELGGGEPYKHKHRTEALIQMKDRPKYEVTKAGKTTPDVLVTH